MSGWTLIDLPLDEGSYGIAGYAVFDALGLRLGYVAGWIKDPDSRVRMLKLAVRDWFDMKAFLVPIGSITLIDDERSQIHLRELTKRSLPKYCLEADEDLPEPQLLKGLIRYFPNPRPSITERLQTPHEVPLSASGRLTVRQDQGDGSRRLSEPVFKQGLSWVHIEHLARPDWTRLSSLSIESHWLV